MSQVKFSLNFVGGWPVLGRIQFCFANAPTVNMDARGYGLYMGYIPGAKSWLVLHCFADFFSFSVAHCFLLSCIALSFFLFFLSFEFLLYFLKF